jgi:hypothetical protein
MHIKFVNDLWQVYAWRNTDECLAWSYTVRALVIAFKERPNLMSEIHKYRNFHIFAHGGFKHTLMDDINWRNADEH